MGFFIFLFAVLLGGVSYVAVRGVQSFSPHPAFRTFYWIGMTLMFVMLISALFSRNVAPALFSETVSFIGFSFLILVLYLFFTFLVIDIIRIINHFTHFIHDMPTFRLWAAIIGLGLTATLMTLGNIRFNHPKTVRLNIETSAPLQRKQVKIVAVSDIHLGVSIGKKRLQQYVAMINAENPDLVLIAGDLIDRSIKPVVENAMEEELKQINAPLGVYAVFGNHEYYGEGAKTVHDFYRKSNITLLRDSCALINNEFYLIGRDDATNRRRKNLRKIVAGLDESKPRILLDHQPNNLQDAQQNRINLQLSGHTHNGQIFPGNLLVKQMFELPYGYKQNGKTHYYTSSGLGIWGPQYRIGSRSEMVVIRFSY